MTVTSPAMSAAPPLGRRTAAPGLRLRALLRNKLAVVALAVLVLLVIAALFAPLIAPYDPNAQDLLLRLKPPAWQSGGSSAHLLGTDQLGRDMLARVIYGTRVSLLVGAGSRAARRRRSAPRSGLVAGYFGGWSDRVLMRLADVQLAFPAILLALAIVGFLGSGLWYVILVLGITGWVSYARVVRSEVMSLRSRDFVTEARAIGVTDGADHAPPPAAQRDGAPRHDRHPAHRRRDRRRSLPELSGTRRAQARPSPGARCSPTASSTWARPGGSPSSRASRSCSPPSLSTSPATPCGTSRTRRRTADDTDRPTTEDSPVDQPTTDHPTTGHPTSTGPAAGTPGAGAPAGKPLLDIRDLSVDFRLDTSTVHAVRGAPSTSTPARPSPSSGSRAAARPPQPCPCCASTRSPPASTRAARSSSTDEIC